MADFLEIDGLRVGPHMVRSYLERIAELEAELLKEKERYAADRKHHYGDGWLGASVEHQGKLQELEAENAALKAWKEQAIELKPDLALVPQPPQQESEQG